jgi:glycosyltransferase involved in cell wall biosynthesis
MAPPDSALLTVVLAAKDPEPAQFDACLASIAGLGKASRIDLIIVISGHLPPIPEACQSRLHRIHIVEQAPRGVYPAYNRGLDEVCSAYVMVMGSDDLLLPGLDKVIESIAASERPHIVAARVLMQDIGLKGPSRFRWGLIFRNWCQQGLLYRTDVFANRRFDSKYRIQADHKLNMELVSDPATIVERREDVICHFSSSGFSQTSHDWVFREDMPGLVRRYYGVFFWMVALAKRGLATLLKRRRRQKRVRA